MGIDIGSVSLNIAVIDEKGGLVHHVYERTNGQPLTTLLNAFSKIPSDFSSFEGTAATGSGKDFLATLFAIHTENEIITQARATAFFHPEVKTVIEIGGQDSKIMFFDHDPLTRAAILTDHALNEICAAGTGSFLDQQALRLGISIDKEFSALALESKKPSIIAGRCSVFAKSDMTHLQQDGVPLKDIIAGLCYSLARNYLSNLVRGRQIKKPVVFQGGVAANKGVVKAFEALLNLKEGELIIPVHYKIMGAIGAALNVMGTRMGAPFNLADARKRLTRRLYEKTGKKQAGGGLLPLSSQKPFMTLESAGTSYSKESLQNCYAGVDIGASSINLILIDENKNRIARLYQLKKGGMIDSLKSAFETFSSDLPPDIRINHVGITGSGRYFIGELIGADTIVNEITAQAAAAIDINPQVDTVIEIGGQDSKFICINNGAVTHFEMNKVCAAGTGSFLQEQAGRLHVSINDEFSACAVLSRAPVNLGTKCTVFMESDLIHHQQTGALKEDLLAGLAYSIANNFMEKVVVNNIIGNTICFQGGVAGNRSVASAFENILGKNIYVPEEYGLTGAYGAAIIAQKQYWKTKEKTRFKGFDIKNNDYRISSFTCKSCPNHCDIKKITINNGTTLFSGGICERYDISREQDAAIENGPFYASKQPDLFSHRKKIVARLAPQHLPPVKNRPVVGIPNILMFHELLPLWHTFLTGLDIHIAVSGASTTGLIHRGLEKVLSETCYPVKIAYGHIIELLDKGVDYLLLPVIIDLENPHTDTLRSFNCPYIQGFGSMMIAAFGPKEAEKFITPTIFMDDIYRNLEDQMVFIGKKLKAPDALIKSAIVKAKASQTTFVLERHQKGTQFFKELHEDEKALVILGKPYNLADPALNLNLADKLRKLGIKAIPYDFIDLDGITLPAHFSNLVWKNEQTLLRALLFSKTRENLFPVLITNYGCGPDAFSFNYIKEIMQDSPYLILEVDEHSGDAGLVTRIEAFWDTLGPKGIQKQAAAGEDLCVATHAGITTYGFLKPSGKITALKKEILIFNGSYLSDIWQAAVMSAGLNARQLPMPDDESQKLGKQYTTSRECHPYILLTGDMVKATRASSFNPDTSAFLMLNYDGSCRMTQYALSHKLVLKRLGIPQVPVIAPLCSFFRDDVTKLFGMTFSINLWKGWIASDFLMKKLLNTRPYEVNKGESDRAFSKAIQDIVDGILHGKFFPGLHRAAQRMKEIKVDRIPKPSVGIVGEFYSCINPWANNDIINVMESLGVEVRVGTSPSDYLIYFNESYPGLRQKEKKYINALYYSIRKAFLMHEKEKIEKIFGAAFYQDFHTPSAARRNRMTAPYIDPAIEPILTINIAKAKEYALGHCSGIVNLIVLNCLYGNVTAAIYRKFQKDNKGIPILTITYDGLKTTNEKTRIEAFIHQVKRFHCKSDDAGER